MITRIVVLLIFVTLLVPSYGFAQNKEVLRQELQTLFEKHPELILDVLREHSEAVLDIAQAGSRQRQHKALREQWAKDITIPKNVDIQGRPIKGDPNAPVTIVAFSDFTCPYCQQASGLMKSVLANYKGKVRYVFKQLPLASHPHARLASAYYVAASKQSPEKAWALYDKLFSGRDALMKKGESYLVAAAAEVGLDIEQLALDAESAEVDAILKQDKAEAERLGMQGTPYFLVNNIMIRGALPLEMFADAIDMALQAKQE